MKVIVLGATGMLGHMLLRTLAANPEFEAHAVVRDLRFVPKLRSLGVADVSCVPDATDIPAIEQLLAAERPDALVNCVSVARENMQSPEWAYPVYSVFPRRLAYACRQAGVRLIQIGSDGVFSGRKGLYSESDIPDAQDVYGRAKLLGEVDGPGMLTLRLSMIGPQLAGNDGLLSWLLRCQGQCRGYTRSVFSGLPTREISRVMAQYVLVNPALSGIYHVAANPISKYELLKCIARSYGLDVDVEADDSLVLDRSLCASRFREAVGYVCPDWPQLVDEMRKSHEGFEGA